MSARKSGVRLMQDAYSRQAAKQSAALRALLACISSLSEWKYS